MNMYECAGCSGIFDQENMADLTMCYNCDARALFNAKFGDSDVVTFIMSADNLDDESEAESADEIHIPTYFTPEDIKKYLDSYVIGQEDLKKALAVAITNHDVIVDHNKAKKREFDLKIPSLLIIGPTGSGKTLAVSKLAAAMDLPFVAVDCTALSSTGYVGQDVEDVFDIVLQQKKRDRDWDGSMIVYFDEVDKIIASKGEHGKDVNGKAVQQGLLKLLEGKEIRIGQERSSKSTFSTHNVLFILSGAFTDLRESLDKKAGKLPIGFETTKGRGHYKITSKDLIDAGMIRELIGRVSHIVETKELTRTELLRVMTEPRDAIVKQYNKVCELRGLEPINELIDLNAVVDLAIKRKVGARGLRQILEEKLQDHMYDAEEKKENE